MSESITDPTVKKAVTEFLREPNFHQNFRLEILFGLAPKTLEPSGNQQHALRYVNDMMLYSGFLRDRGLKSLATIIAFEKITDTQLGFKSHVVKISDFFKTG